MRLDNEFTVGVPVEQAWAVLTDLELIAPCMPGAQLTGVNDGVYSGKVKIKVGPVTAEYSGTAQFSVKDETAYRAVIDARGRDSRGNGNAAAVISAGLQSAGESTVVSVSTDLMIAGRIAQFGSGMIKEVSAKLLGQFVTCLEGKLSAGAMTSTAAAGTALANGSPAGTAPANTAATGTAPANTAATSAASANTAATGAAPVKTAPAKGSPAGTATANTAATSAASANTAATGAAPVNTAPANGSPAGTATANTAATSAASVSVAPASPAATSAGPGGTAPLPAVSLSASGPEPAAIDLMSVAGRAVFKRLVPLVIGVIVLAVIIYLIVR